MYTNASARYTLVTPHTTTNDQAERHPTIAARRERCDVHHSVAQLYLSALSPPTFSGSTAVESRRRRKRASRMAVSASTTVATVPVEEGKPATTLFDPTARFLPSCADSTDESETASSSSSDDPAHAVTSTQLRALLASSMSAMYRAEVPLYADLLRIISRVNAHVIRRLPPSTTLTDDEIARLNVERHGAIRVGTAAELALLARIFRVFGMHAVGYYDLHRDARLPIHATAFRPVGAAELVSNPFRIFCSLLRMDLIADARTRAVAQELLAKRQIVSPRCVALLVQAEAQGGVEGLTRAEALEFVERVVDIFAWHKDTPVSLAQYQLLAHAHPLVADIVSFRGPHINHLTPRTLDIDRVQADMLAEGIDAKEVIEGPPVRRNAVYLRQTSFHALSESVEFVGAGGTVEGGKHKARFGEIEARGQALTRKGARLYDALMEQVARVKREREERKGESVGKDECVQILRDVFEAGFADSKDAILRQALGYFAFSVKDSALAKGIMRGRHAEEGCELLADLVDAGALEAEPITYEDFLPASAAGIFQSNLPSTSDPARQTAESASIQMDESEARTVLEAAVGGTILDYFELYAEQQSQSLLEVGAVLGADVHALIETVARQGA
ncbi:conserved hypothetical protein [Sporisorium reilianum SRZ2]|uniref:2-oxoadipate dioxygenase/decarboxylase n=1 Tax=Sporisorium reilianum (strain SRZ2) TaxID=999809 RepID=E6ZM23_SPORE|nr:conserved hypothetical protein [Sporisorium reilianum SRZ2]